MIKQKVKVKIKRKNPFTDTNDVKDYISKNSFYFNYLDKGYYSTVYRFKTDKKLVLNTKILNPGDYVLKILRLPSYHYSINELKYLEKLSKYGLTPKIFIITKSYSIIKYIDGYTFSEIREKWYNEDITEKEYLRITSKIGNLIAIWNNLGFNHDDLHNDNILVSKNLNSVYLIDPSTNNLK